MSGVLKKSLASWREEHGFGILCIISPEGELFLVGPDEDRIADRQAELDPAWWTGLSEPQLRQHLAERGFSRTGTDDAIQLSREWATTITGSSVFPAPPESN